MKRWTEPLIVFLGVAVIHLLMINEFGATLDEPIHRQWAQHVLLSLQTGDPNVLYAMPGNSIVYGPFFFLLNFFVSDTLSRIVPITFVAANHVTNVLAFALGTTLLFCFARTAFSKRTAWTATLVFVLIPTLVAHAHYNPKDIPVTTAAIAAVFGAYYALRRRTRASAVVAGSLFGVALAVKLSALLLLPIFAAAYAMTLQDHRQRTHTSLLQDLVLVAIFALSAGIVMLLLWPSAWMDLRIIPGSFRFFLGGSAVTPENVTPLVLYFGREYAASDVPWHYIPFWLLATLPIPTAFLFLIGTIRAAKKPSLEHSLLLAWIFVPLLISILPGMPRYDGFRQFFFALPAVAILAAIGFNSVTSWLAEKITNLRRLSVPLLCMVFVGWVGAEIIAVHPYEGSYMNPIVRLALPSHIEESLEIEYWGATYKEGLAWLDEHAEPSSVICVPLAGRLLLWYPLRTDYVFDCGERTNYVMYFSRYKDPALDARDPVFEIRRYDSRLLAILKVR